MRINKLAKKLFGELAKYYLKTIQELNKEDIEFVIIKLPLNKPSLVNDIDIIINPEQTTKLNWILKKQGFFLFKEKLEKHGKTYKKHTAEGFVSIDVYTCFLGPFNLISAKDIFQNSRKTTLLGELIRTPDKTTNKIITAMQPVLRKRKYKAYEKDIITEYSKENSKKKFEQKILTVLRQKKNPEQINKTLQELVRKKYAWILFCQKIKTGKYLLKSKWNKLQICFVGVDGSGKSTIIEGLKKQLNETSGLQAKSIHYGENPKLLTTKIICNYISKGKASKKKEKRDQIEKAKKNMFLKQVYYINHYFEYLYRYITEVLIDLDLTTKIKFVDRYPPYDIFVQDDMAKNSKILKFLTYFAIKPDVIIYLHNDPEIIYKRKQDLTLQQITEQQKGFRELVKNKKRMIEISTKNKTPEKTIAEAMMIILPLIQRRLKY